MKYVIQYTHDYWSLGCDCCTDYSSEMEIYDENGTSIYYNAYAPFIEDEKYLREWVNEMLPQYNKFDIHEDTQFA